MNGVGFAVSFCVFNGKSPCGRWGTSDRRKPYSSKSPRKRLWTLPALWTLWTPKSVQRVSWTLELQRALLCPVESPQFLVIPFLLLLLSFISREAQLYNLSHLSVIALDTWRPSDCHSSWYIMNLLDMQRSLCHKRFSHYNWAFTCLSRVSKPSPSPHSQSGRSAAGSCLLVQYSSEKAHLAVTFRFYLQLAGEDLAANACYEESALGDNMDRGDCL